VIGYKPSNRRERYGHVTPGTVKSFDSDKVQRTLKAVLASFAFLRWRTLKGISLNRVRST
jgi:hypothetical protein